MLIAQNNKIQKPTYDYIQAPKYSCV